MIPTLFEVSISVTQVRRMGGLESYPTRRDELTTGVAKWGGGGIADEESQAPRWRENIEIAK